MTTGAGMDAEEKETLWRYQHDVRRAAERLHDLLIHSEDEDQKDSPRLPHVEEMIDYECETWGVLKEVIEQALKLGKE